MTPFEQYALIATGGAVGSCVRFALGSAITGRFTHDFPWGTFAINVTGSLVIGALLTAVTDLGVSNPRWKPLLAVGFCGGYTTFSSFAWETLQLLEAHRPGLAAGYVVASSVAGILAVVAGA